MSLILYSHETCSMDAVLTSAYCVEMSDADNSPVYTIYTIPVGLMSVSDILAVYIAKQVNAEFVVELVPSLNITSLSGNRIQLNNIDPASLTLHNRVIVVPKTAFNLCFTGRAGSNPQSKRPIWIKRSDSSKMYDYLTITSINYFHRFFTIQEYMPVEFVSGTSNNFFNLTSDHIGMCVDFDGQYVGTINSVNGVTSLTLDTNFTSNGSSRAFLYARGTVEYALDVNGEPSNIWSRHLNLPPITDDIPIKVWVRDFKTVTEELTSHPNNSIRILGTEFLI